MKVLMSPELNKMEKVEPEITTSVFIYFLFTRKCLILICGLPICGLPICIWLHAGTNSCETVRADSDCVELPEVISVRLQVADLAEKKE